jgi:hypothetical protein
MSRVKPSIIASLLLALLLLLLAAPVVAQDLVIYLEPTVTGVQDNNGVYIGDVDVKWILDPEDEGGWVVVTGCEDTRIIEDTGPEGVDLWCHGTAPDGIFGGAVNIVRQAAPPELVFPELKQSTALLLGVDRIVSQGQVDSMLVKLDLAEIKYYMGELIVTGSVLHAVQNEMVALRGSITSEWLLIQSLRRVVTPSMVH